MNQEFNCPPPCEHEVIVGCDKCRITQLERELAAARQDYHIWQQEKESLTQQLAVKERELEEKNETANVFMNQVKKLQTNLTTLQQVARELAKELKDELLCEFGFSNPSKALTTYNNLPPSVRGEKE